MKKQLRSPQLLWGGFSKVAFLLHSYGEDLLMVVLNPQSTNYHYPVRKQATAVQRKNVAIMNFEEKLDLSCNE